MVQSPLTRSRPLHLRASGHPSCGPVSTLSTDCSHASPRRSSGNVASPTPRPHGLRTPIAELRTTIDVARRCPEPQRLTTAVERADLITDRMARLIEGLPPARGAIR
ncbi:MAG: hypothetical protein IPJ41_04410 [Phycisphaerales bacterium]|nr:hypothetical protein [Phycisphaerales bacterium]